MYDSASTFKEFKEILQEHEIQTHTKFITRRVSGVMSDEKFVPTKHHRILWDKDIPFVVAGTRIYACHQGSDNNTYQKKKYADKREENAKMNCVITKRYNLKQPSKKLGCPVQIKLQRIMRFPRHMAPTNSERAKRRQTAAIRTKICANQGVVGEEVFLFSLPDVSQHKNHCVGEAAAVKEPLDPRVLQKIKEFARHGVKDVGIMAQLVYDFVSREIGEENRQSRRFFPPRDVVRSVMARVKKEPPLETINVINKKELIKECNSSISLLQSIFCLLPAESMAQLRTNLIHLFGTLTSQIPVEESSKASKHQDGKLSTETLKKGGKRGCKRKGNTENDYVDTNNGPLQKNCKTVSNGQGNHFADILEAAAAVEVIEKEEVRSELIKCEIVEICDMAANDQFLPGEHSYIQNAVEEEVFVVILPEVHDYSNNCKLEGEVSDILYSDEKAQVNSLI